MEPSRKYITWPVPVSTDTPFADPQCTGCNGGNRAGFNVRKRSVFSALCRSQPGAIASGTAMFQWMVMLLAEDLRLRTAGDKLRRKTSRASRLPVAFSRTLLLSQLLPALFVLPRSLYRKRRSGAETPGQVTYTRRWLPSLTHVENKKPK